MPFYVASIDRLYACIPAATVVVWSDKGTGNQKGR